ncbi:MAG: glycosyltransferase family 2 protein [Nitrospirae bacterium]|nr:glycosyltransferase family 2 protein [Nitrospirota bacterium]
MKISFVIPAYNEQMNIGAVLSQLRSNFPQAEIIVVDDASTDDTSQEAAKYNPDKVIRHNNNRGNGAALKTGIKNASGDFVIFVDSDGQHPIEEVIKVVNAVEATPGIDAVFTKRENIYASGMIRAAGKIMIRQVVSSLTGEHNEDHNCGLKAFRTEKILPFLFMLPDGFSLHTTSMVLAYKEDFKVQWINIRMEKRTQGKSRVSISDGFKTLVLVIRLILIFDPLKFFMPISLYSLFVGLVSISISLFQNRTIGKNYIFFFLFSMLIFILGMLSEQISMLRKEITFIKNERR